MSSINSRVPPLRLAAVDSPADGEVAAYQSSSGQFEWVANGSGGGGTVTSVALTETGSALTITGSPITGAGTFNIAGAGTSSQVILGDLSLGTLTSGTVTSVSSSQAFISIATPTTTPSISIGNASASATGVLTSTDWNTFNNKGSGTVTSVGLTETGSALTITGSPITGSGTFNIEGAGTSSQVILGDLSLGTLTSGTVTGTGVTNQVSYWTSTTAQAGSTGLTYNPSTGDLTVGGYVETGTKITTPSGTNLELSPGGASSGSIVIADGANGQISLNPNGTGTVKIDGVEIDNSAIATGYVLKATSTTAAGWAAESGGGGGGSPGGSDTQIQYNNGGSFGGSSVMTFDDTGSAEQVLFSGTSSKAIFKVEQLGAGNSIEVHDAATDTTIFLVDQYGRAAIKTNAVSSGYDLTVGGSTFVQGHLKLSTVGTTSAPAIKWDGDTTTGINRPSPGEIAIVASGTETFRFGANNDLEIAGNAGTSGQVLTSGGAGAAASWTTPSGGGSGFLQPPVASGAIAANYNKYPIFASAPYGTGDTGSFSSTAFNQYPCMRPFVLGEGGTWGGVAIYVDSASLSNAVLISLYESDSDGMPAAFIGYCEVSTTSTGSVTQTSTLDSGGSASTFTLSKDTQYWCSFVMKNNNDSTTFRMINIDGLATLGNSNMSNAGTILRNTNVSNAIETTNPPRNNQIVSNGTAPHIGLIM